MTADLAVVVVNFNAGEHLRTCVGSVYAAAGDLALDVAVVDNASRDGSAEAAAAANPSIRVIDNPVNRGFAAAANRGFAETEAPFVFLLNPDAAITGGRLDAFVKVAKERPRAGALGCLVRNPDGSLQPSARKVPGIGEGLAHAFLGRVAPDNRWSRSYTMAEWDRASEREVEWVSGSAMLVRREAFHAVGGFDEGYFMYVEDVDLCTRLRKRGWSVLFTPELEVTHEVGVSTRSHPRRMAYEHSRSIYRYFSKHVATGPAIGLRPLARAALWARAALIARRSPEDRVAGPRRRPR
ncbi:MAG TPA: glycosyltransferase family 2 protein [Actinomycetota bacterium]